MSMRNKRPTIVLAFAAAVFSCREADPGSASSNPAVGPGTAPPAVITLDGDDGIPPCTASTQAQVYHTPADAKLYYCDGSAYHIVELASPPGSLIDAQPAFTCPSVGVLIRAGLDTNGNGQLEAAEVLASKAVCNPTDGTNGSDGGDGNDELSCSVRDNGDATKTVSCSDGSQLTVVVEPDDVGREVVLNIVSVAPTAECPYGGRLIETGADLDSNGVLDAAEVTDRSSVCTPNEVVTGMTAPVIDAPSGGDVTLEVNAPRAFSALFSGDQPVTSCALEYVGADVLGSADTVLESSDGGVTGIVRGTITFPDLSALLGVGSLDWQVRFVCTDAGGRVGYGPPIVAHVLPAPPRGACSLGGTYQQTIIFNSPMACATSGCSPEVCSQAQDAIQVQEQYVAELTVENATSLGSWSSDLCTRVNHFTGSRGDCSIDYSIILTDVDAACDQACGAGSSCSGGRCIGFCLLNGEATPHDTALQECLTCGGETSLETPGTTCPIPAPLVWPNPLGPANSSPWLRDNHDVLTELRPRVLVLDVAQGEGRKPIDEVLDDYIRATEEMTRYHGYSDPDARPFLRYQVDKVLDLKDPAGAQHPDATAWPVVGGDIGALFADDFAPVLGYPSPEDPSRFMPMCELFERGIINELWIAAENDRNIFENQSRLQVYDDSLQPLENQFNACTNGCYNDARQLVNCKVSVRMQELSKTRGPGCLTHAAGHTFESLPNSIPYLAENATRFFGFDLDARYDLAYPSLYNACPFDVLATAQPVCLDHPSPDVLSSGPAYLAAPFSAEGWGSACGSVHFPPNASFHYDYHSSVAALNTCESYGLQDGPDGTDRQREYTDALVNEYEAAHGKDFSCGGGWMIYLGQSVPGLGNRARDVEGEPMHNWWPFLFY